MVLSLILIILVLVFFPDVLVGCLSILFVLFILGIVVAVSKNIYSLISPSMDDYDWRIVIIIIFLIIVFIAFLLKLWEIHINQKYINELLLDLAKRNESKRAIALLERNPNVNARNGMKTTPLMMACENGNIELVKELIKAKAKINLKNKNGDTAYTLAKSKGYEEMANMLIAAGAKKTR